jgi:hypothetical protein
MDKWIRCSAIRLKNGKLQIKNPGFWGSLFQQRSGGASQDFNKKYTESYFKKKAKKKKYGYSSSLTKSQIKAAQRADAKFAATAGRIKTEKIKTIPASDFNDAVKALIGQGASKSQANLAVKAAAARGARGFESLFRGALRELK